MRKLKDVASATSGDGGGDNKTGVKREAPDSKSLLDEIDKALKTETVQLKKKRILERCGCM